MNAEYLQSEYVIAVAHNILAVSFQQIGLREGSGQVLVFCADMMKRHGMTQATVRKSCYEAKVVVLKTVPLLPAVQCGRYLSQVSSGGGNPIRDSMYQGYRTTSASAQHTNITGTAQCIHSCAHMLTYISELTRSVSRCLRLS